MHARARRNGDASCMSWLVEQGSVGFLQLHVERCWNYAQAGCAMWQLCTSRSCGVGVMHKQVVQ
eukprot:140549-Chlamydomonas_euryale.AAC.1